MSDKIFPLVLSGAILFLGVAIFSLDSVYQSSQVSDSRPEAVFPEVSIEAKSAYVYDLRTGEEIFAKNPDKRLPLASLTKLMSALVASELSPDFATVTVTSEALATYGDSGLRSEERWSLKNLLDFSLVTSSNDGIRAVALALGGLEHLGTRDEVVESFVTEMNKKASLLGLKNTYFWNETGLDESEAKGGAYGSARDISTLVSYIMINHTGLLEATQETEIAINSDQTTHLAKNTNALAGAIPGLLASKTGFTDIAGGNITFVFDPELGRPIVVTILGSSAEGRFADAQKLIAGTLDYLKTN